MINPGSISNNYTVYALDRWGEILKQTDNPIPYSKVEEFVNAMDSAAEWFMSSLEELYAAEDEAGIDALRDNVLKHNIISLSDMKDKVAMAYPEASEVVIEGELDPENDAWLWTGEWERIAIE